jgi:serine/threonine protein phosphatase PrpC
MEISHTVAAAQRQLQWSGRTECGPRRPNNEDAFIALLFDSQEVHHLGATGEGLLRDHNFLFAVSDGMGGAAAGEHASQIAVQEITKLLPKFYDHSEDRLQGEYAAVLEELFVKIHKSLTHLGRSYEECRGMEATLSLCWFTKTRMFFAHVGDCRIYRFSQNSAVMDQLTQDDTHVGWLFRNGHINERQARNHPRRKSLQKALGGNHQFVSPQVGTLSYEAGDRFLICSDGLIEAFYDQQLRDFFQSNDSRTEAKDLARHLVNEALSRSGQDNTTAIVIEVSGATSPLATRAF